MNILLTGITGFIGSHVAQNCLQDLDCRIIAPVRSGSALKTDLVHHDERLIVKEGVFYEEEFIGSLFRACAIDTVVHMAALRGSGRGTKHDYRLVNVTGTENLLNLAYQHRVKRFIFCSSVGVWGTIPSTTPADASTPLIGDSLYHQSKIDAEEKVHEYARKGREAIIVRPTITYGDGDDGFPRTLVELVRKRKLILPLADVKIHLVSVKKLAELFVQLISANHVPQRMILGVDREAISLHELVNVIQGYYYGKVYPLYMRVPKFIFTSGIIASRLFNNDVWATRFKLLSRDWYFDTTDMKENLDFEAGDTLSEFKKYLDLTASDK